ncbi:uncharacterized protein [Chelonus insularis]|uniref:uncharacterized protein n=1 Tax=Chelonus insularis TaxID=460826 RepID=UPI00158D6994|nr:uncharacterized protein LOC118065866 [Chelonus insularis]
MHFPIILSIFIICASLQINAKPIDSQILADLVKKSKELKNNFAQTLENQTARSDVNSEDLKLINEMYDLSARVEEIISSKLETNPKPVDAKELADLLGKNAEIKRDAATNVQKRVDNHKTTPKDWELVGTVLDLSKTVREVIAFVIESQLDALDTPTPEPHDPKRDVEPIDEDYIPIGREPPKKYRL